MVNGTVFDKELLTELTMMMPAQILNVGLEWAGFPALAFYMHSLLKQLQV